MHLPGRPAVRRAGSFVKVAAALAVTCCAILPASTQLAGAAPASFVALTPARLMDTRTGGSTVDGQGPKGPLLDAAAPVCLQVAGRGGVPPAPDADAASLNLTVVGPTTGGFAKVWPKGQPEPSASTINYAARVTIANAVLMKLGDGGQICIRSFGGTLDVLVDVSGYFPTGTSYHSLSPKRMMDTRPGLSTDDGQGPTGAVGGKGVDLQVTGRFGIPTTGVGAVALNVVATQPTAAGFLKVYPSDQRQPNASSLNYVAGQTVANLVVVPVSATGTVRFVNPVGTTYLIADVVGWFPTGSDYVPQTPWRALDTRQGGSTADGQAAGGGAIQANKTVTLQLTGRIGIPTTDVSSVILNVTAFAPTAAGFLTVYPAGLARPNGSNVNFPGRTDVPNLVVAKLGEGGKVTIYSESITDVIVDVAGYFKVSRSTSPLDASFGGSGSVDLASVVHVQYGTSPATVSQTNTGAYYAIANQGGTTELRRFAATGAADTAFGSGGVVTLPPDEHCSSYGSRLCGLTVDASGRALLGTADDQGQTVVRRYSLTGTTDFATTLPTLTSPSSIAIAAAADGSLFAAAADQIAKLGSDGAVLATSAIAGGTEFLYPYLSPQYPYLYPPQGALLVADSASRPLLLTIQSGATAATWGVRRLTTALLPDGSFDGDGFAVIGSGALPQGALLGLDATDAGYLVATRSATQAAVVRIGQSGAVDTSYGVGGAAAIPTRSGNDVVMQVEATGAGSGRVMEALVLAANSTYYVSRLTSTGSPDTTFGPSGTRDLTGFEPATNGVFGTTPAPTGLAGTDSSSGMLVFGTVVDLDPTFQRVSAAGARRLADNGTFDASFGGSGTARWRTIPLAVAPQQLFASGSGVIAIFRAPGVIAVRVNGNGTVDTTYGHGGVLADPGASAATVDPSGRLVVYRTFDSSGLTFPSAGEISRSITRFGATGLADPTFASAGSFVWPDVAATSYGGCPARLTSLSDASTLVTYGALGQCTTTGFDAFSAVGAVNRNWGAGLGGVLAGSGTFSPGGVSAFAATSGKVYLAHARDAVTTRVVRAAGASGVVDTAFGGSSGIVVTGQLSGVLADDSIVTSTGGTPSQPTGVAGFRKYGPTGTAVINSGGYGADGLVPLDSPRVLADAGQSILATRSTASGANSVVAFDAYRADGLPDIGYPEPGVAGGAVQLPGTGVVVSVLAGRTYILTGTTLSRVSGTLP